LLSFDFVETGGCCFVVAGDALQVRAVNAQAELSAAGLRQVINVESRKTLAGVAVDGRRVARVLARSLRAKCDATQIERDVSDAWVYERVCGLAGAGTKRYRRLAIPGPWPVD